MSKIPWPDADKLVELCGIYGKRIADFYSDEVSQGVTLTPDETDLLDTYRSLNYDGQKVAISVLRALVGCGEYDD